MHNTTPDGEVHESFRSENVLFFPVSDSKWVPEPVGSVPRIDYGDPCVPGFEFTQPEIDFSFGFTDFFLERDVYRHPERQGRPGKMFNKIHDIYALFKTACDPFVIQAQLFKQAQ
ncbi:uncharacterized protein BDR25DRAFT_311845 [Lindgomyces ingoldianus]|uniref:Uncharacterized protein n=1 Tax=Lindgomyces ingoldianus TaxID=673940 RepID=A0ACB6R2X5_9PLEO|nr:uncharacterized protein BDR25DRAFT_311845 [Lindgomyces ingoldianus]KAF2473628.1 hypothetical protein BDR25DRAFT_311845 [Lindgomyces ingoldianus]